MLHSETEITDIFKISIEELNSWVINGLPKVEEDGINKYDINKVVSWKVSQELSLLKPKGKYSTEIEKARLLHHQANNEALKEKLSIGELVRVEDVVNKWSNAVLAMRNKLLSLPSRIAKVSLSSNDELQIQSDIERLIHDALSELSLYTEDEKPTKKVVRRLRKKADLGS